MENFKFIVLWNASRIHKSFYMSKNASKAVPKSVSQMTKLCKNLVCLCVSSGASNIQIIHSNKQILYPTSILSFSISTCTYSYQYLGRNGVLICFPSAFLFYVPTTRLRLTFSTNLELPHI